MSPGSLAPHLLKGNSETSAAGCTHAQDHEAGSLLEKGKGFLRNSIPHLAWGQGGEGKEQLSTDGNAPDFSASPSRDTVAIPKHLAGAVCFTEGKHSMNLEQIQI